MAVVNRTSAAITNRDAVPRVISSPAAGAGDLKEKVAYIAAVTDDSATSIARLFSIPSNARVSELLVTAADFTTAGVANVGLYRTTQDGGALVDVDFFASLLDFSGGPFANLDVINESGDYALAESEQMIWQALGLTSDPGIEYDVAYTISTNFNGGQPSKWKIRYVV